MKVKAFDKLLLFSHDIYLEQVIQRCCSTSCHNSTVNNERIHVQSCDIDLCNGHHWNSIMNSIGSLLFSYM